MTTSISPFEARLRGGFKYFNRLLLLWRLGFGRWLSSWPSVGGRLMVLTTIGRTSGIPRRTPLNYALVDGAIYCTAGFGSISDWYRNIRANPAVELWLPDGWWAGEAHEVDNDPARLPLLREVLMAAGSSPHLRASIRTRFPTMRSPWQRRTITSFVSIVS